MEKGSRAYVRQGYTGVELVWTWDADYDALRGLRLHPRALHALSKLKYIDAEKPTR